MCIADSGGGATREAQAIKALEDGVLDQLQKKFQIRIYRLDRQISRVPKLDDLKTAPPASATRIGDGLKQLAGEAADLPIGAVVLLSDGADNSGGIDLDTISTLRSRRIPVHTVGFGAEQVAHDVEIDDAVSRPARWPIRVSPPRSVAPAWLRRAESHADGARRREGSRGAASYSRWRRRRRPRTLLFNAGRRRSEDAAVFDRPAAGRRKQAPTIPSRGLVNVESDQAASPVRRGRAALGIQIHPPRGAGRPLCSPSSRCCEPAKTKFIARESTILKNWPMVFPSRAEDLFRLPGAHHRFGGGKLLYGGAAGADPAIRRSPRWRFAAAGRPRFAWRMEVGAPRASPTCCRSPCPIERYVPSRPGNCRTDAARRRQHHHAAGGRPRHAMSSAGRSSPT